MDRVSLAATDPFMRWMPKAGSPAIGHAQASGHLDAVSGLCRQALEASGLGLCLIELSFDLHGQPAGHAVVLAKPPLLLQPASGTARDETVTGLKTLDWLDESAVSVLCDVLRTRKPHRFLHKFTSAQRWFDIQATPVDRPAANQVLVLFDDVTERYRELASMRLREAIASDEAASSLAHRRRIEQHMEAMPVGLMVHDANGLMHHANRTALAHWPQPLPRAPGDYATLNGLWAPGSAQAGRQLRGDDWPLPRAIRNGSVATDRISMATGESSGHRIVLQVSVTPIYDPNQRITGFVQTSIDVTHQTEAMEGLRNEIRCNDDFITTLVHELRNPLAPIKTAAQTLAAKESRNAQARRCVQIILRQASHLSHLIDDMTDLRKIHSGILTIEPDIVDLNALVREAIEQVQPLIEQQGHVLKVSEPATPLRIHADPSRIVQIFSNLLTNAARYTPAGGSIDVTIANKDGHAVVSVKDNGIGIGAQLLARAFHPYVRGPEASASAQEGFGIGLALVKSLVDLHHGKVSVHSAGQGCGSEFVVELPLHASSHAETLEPPEAKAAPLVLIVDDNRDSADSMGMLLEMYGYETFIAYSGASAIEFALARPPEVAIIDMLMPDMNGDQVVRQLRQQQALRHTTFIALTGMNERLHRNALEQAGFDHVFTKPVDVPQLLKLLESSTQSPQMRLGVDVPFDAAESTQASQAQPEPCNPMA